MTTYSDEVISDSPTLYWRCGEALGPLLDISGNGFDAVSSPAAYGVPGLLVRDLNKAVRINDAYFGGIQSFNSFAGAPASSFTVEGLVRLSALDPSGGTLLGIVAESGIGIDSSGNIFGQFTDSASVHHETPPYLLSLGVIYHLVLTYDGTSLTLYVNGEAVETSSPGGTGLWVSSSYFAVGLGYSSALVVDIDEAAFYDATALTSTRIVAHYAAASPTVPADTVSAFVTIFDVVPAHVLTVHGQVSVPSITFAAHATPVPLIVHGSATVGVPRIVFPYDRWRPRVKPDGTLVLLSCTQPGEHDTTSSNITFWTFLPNGQGRVEVKGTPGSLGWSSYGHPEWSPHHDVVAIFVETSTKWRIAVLNAETFATGHTLYEVTKPASCTDPSYSPTGAIVFVEQSGGTYHISTLTDAATPVHAQIKSSSNRLADPYYSPDGTHIIYSEQTGAVTGPEPYGEWDLKVMAADGTGATTVLANTHPNQHPTWLDLDTVIFQTFRYGVDTDTQIASINTDGSNFTFLGIGEYPQVVSI